MIWLAATTNPDDLIHLAHLHVWAEVVEHLSHEWRLDVDRVRNALVGRFAAVPRGRVGFTHQGYWVVGRGTEIRVPNDVERLGRAFRLDKDLVRLLEDDHWDPLPSDVAAIKNLLHGSR